MCLAVGKKHKQSLMGAIDDFTRRLEHYVSFTWQLLPAATGKKTRNELKRVESAALLARLLDDDYVVLLDERGIQLASSDLAAMLDTLDLHASKRVVFVIGGAYGVTDQLKQRADALWSLSRLTFPHQIVRLLLVEQLYRACTIRRGESYHHE